MPAVGTYVQRRRMTSTLARSYRVCETIARREAANFYPAFCLLPRAQRLAMCALYAFFRIADDLGDNEDTTDRKRIQLQAWRSGLEEALLGHPTHAIHPALVDTIVRFRIPVQYLHDVIDGVEMDLEPCSYQTFQELRLYCYRVASAVGLACIHVWGFRDERAKVYAEEAGIAFQLTNILRDLKEDAARDRIYLPQEDLIHFGYEPAQLAQGQINERFKDLMRFEVERARGFYRTAWPLTRLLAPAGRSVFLVMARTYRALLDAIERRQYDVFSSRVRLSPWKKALLAFSALPVRLGWM